MRLRAGEHAPASAVGPATLADVARLAGVSPSTASRVLNGGTRTPSEGSRQRVLAAAARLRYSPNAAAQATARGRTNVIGLIVRDISDPYFTSIAAGAMRAADEFGAVTTIADSRHDFEREARLIAALQQQRARAIVIVGSRTTRTSAELGIKRAIGDFAAAGGRVVLISQKQHDADTIVIENRAGARALARALIGLGYKRFAVIGGPPELRTSADRLSGFREGLSRSGLTLPEDRLVTTEFTRDGGHAGARALLRAGPPPECVFAVNDVMAVGAMAAFREHGLSLPADLAVAGFDDIQMLSDIVPALTTVRVPLEALGSEAVRMALDESGGGQPGERTRRFACQVIVRDSTPARS